MEFSEFKNLITEYFSLHIGIDLSELQCHSFFDYMNIIIETNKVINLTAITEPREIIVRHFLDSNMPIHFYSDMLNGNYKIADIGTGAGFPGIPLAIVCPNCSFVLNDTLNKRIKFLSDVISTLNLKNVFLVKARAEDFGHDKYYRESFDFVVSRGVSKMSVLSEYTLPFVKIGGSLLAYKMFNCDDEISDGSNAIKTLGGKFHVKHKYSIIESDPDRCIVEINKITSTPKSYPRRAGTPSSKPL